MPGGALTTYPYKSPPFFLRPGGAPAPTPTPDYTYELCRTRRRQGTLNARARNTKETRNIALYHGVQVAQLSQRETALQGGLVMAKSGRLELRDNIYGDYRYLVNHYDVIGQQSNRLR